MANQACNVLCDFAAVRKPRANTELETCFYLPQHTQFKKLNVFLGREEVDGRHAWTNSKLLNLFHAGERKYLGKRTAAVGLAF